MLARDYQDEATMAGTRALKEHGNALIVMAPGGGKTFIAGKVIEAEAAEMPEARFLVMQHTDEILEQNQKTITAVTGIPGTIVKAAKNDFSGRIVYASTPTLARDNRLRDLLAATPFTHLIIDEAHRAGTDCHSRIVDAMREIIPDLKTLGLTATPSRPDGASLRKIFTNVAHHTSIPDLIRRGILVPPRGFKIDLADLSRLPANDNGDDTAGMEEAAALLNLRPLNDAVLANWVDKAFGRKSIFFTTTIDHAEALAETFNAAGIKAAVISARTSKKSRRQILHDLEWGDLTVVVNCMALTEGFDCPPVSCVGIVRPMVHKTTFIQAVGRGLRTLDAVKYPGLLKTDCIVLDFAGAIHRHGGLGAEIIELLDDGNAATQMPGSAPHKICPDCEAEIAAAMAACPFCGHAFPKAGSKVLSDFRMVEADLLADSPFAWTEIGKKSLIACGFNGWAGVFEDRGRWHAIARPKSGLAYALRSGTKLQAMSAADDFLRSIETSDGAKRGRTWLMEPASEKQLAQLQSGDVSIPQGLTKYGAACRINYLWSRKAIWAVLYGIRRETATAA